MGDDKRDVRRSKNFQEYQKRKNRERKLTPEEEELRRIRLEEKRKAERKAYVRGEEPRRSTGQPQNPRGNSNRSYEDGERVNKRAQKKKSSVGKIVKRTLLGLVALLAIIIVFTGFNVMSFLSKINRGDMIAPLEVSGKESVNILILGMDIGDPENVENKDVKRTDTIMVFNYHPKTHKANLVSIPRDTLIKTPKGNNAKINSAYEIGGEEFIKSKVEEFLSINVNYMVKIDYNAFRSFIDSIGGIDMYIERDMIYDDPGQNLHINFKGGETVHLDGKKAEEFFRWRKNNDGTGFANGDLDRIKNQQLFVKKVIEKCTTPSILLKTPKILDAIAKDVETNMPPSKLMGLGFDLIRISPTDVNMVTLQGEPEMINNLSYVVYDRKANADIINALKNPGSNLTKIDRENLNIKMYNATKINGLAASYEIDLRNLGYEKIDTGNVELRDKSVIMVNDDNIKNMFKNDFSAITKYDKIDPNLNTGNYDIIIVLGKDAKNF